MDKKDLLKHIRTEELVTLLVSAENAEDIELLRAELKGGRRKVADFILDRLDDAALEVVDDKKSRFYGLITHDHIKAQIERHLDWEVGFQSFQHELKPIVSADEEICAEVVAYAKKVNACTPQHLGYLAEKMAKILERLCKVYKPTTWESDHIGDAAMKRRDEIKRNNDWNAETGKVTKCIRQVASLKFLHDQPAFILAMHDAATALKDQQIFKPNAQTKKAIEQICALPVADASAIRELQARAREEGTATRRMLAALQEAKEEITLPQLVEAIQKCEQTHETLGRALPQTVEDFHDFSRNALSHVVKCFVKEQIAKGRVSEDEFKACASSVAGLLSQIKNTPLYADLSSFALQPISKLTKNEAAYWAKWAQKIAPALEG
jgi:hypothetical protein